MAASTRSDQPGPTRKPLRKAGITTSADDEWITVPEILKELKLERRTWQHWVTRGKTPKNMIKLPSGRYRVRRADYQAWLLTLRVDA